MAETKRRYLLQLLTFNKDNPMQALDQTSVEGDSLIEIAAKIPLMITTQLRKEHEDEMLELRMQNDDIPF